jgi:hypothetical protein
VAVTSVPQIVASLIASGSSAVTGLREFARAVSNQFRDDPPAAEALALAQRTPSDQEATDTLALHVSRHMEVDAVFRDRLLRLLDAAQDDPASRDEVARIAGGC